MKQIISLVVILGIFTYGIQAWAIPNSELYVLKTPGITRILTLPENANSSPVIYLGQAIDPQTHQLVDGYAFIYKNIKPSSPAKKGSAKCYAFLSKGAKWNLIEPWVVNTNNTQGLTESFVLNNISNNIIKWEDAADGILDGITNINILGEGSTTSSLLEADTITPDGQNEIYFANISSPNAIAVTIVWGTFSGPLTSRQIVEWDQVYDDVDYNWSQNGEPNKMDFENISTHELGHSVGMNDIYETVCSEVTMYGYANEGEINKRTLEAADVLGISTLY